MDLHYLPSTWRGITSRRFTARWFAPENVELDPLGASGRFLLCVKGGGGGFECESESSDVTIITSVQGVRSTRASGFSLYRV